MKARLLDERPESPDTSTFVLRSNSRWRGLRLGHFVSLRIRIVGDPLAALGSSSLDGGPAFHFLSGNLSFQIEHHLCPDVPALRYADMEEKAREVCDPADPPRQLLHDPRESNSRHCDLDR